MSQDKPYTAEDVQAQQGRLGVQASLEQLEYGKGFDFLGLTTQTPSSRNSMAMQQQSQQTSPFMMGAQFNHYDWHHASGPLGMMSFTA